MKYLVLIPDGMADRPIPELGNKTPMAAAKKENIAMVQINRNIIQRIFRKCTVVIWFTAETPSRYKVKGLWLKEGRSISEMLIQIPETTVDKSNWHK